MIRLFIVEITGEKKDKKLLDKTRAMHRFVGTSSGSSRFREASRKLAPSAAPPLPVKTGVLTGVQALTIYLHYALREAPSLTQIHLANLIQPFYQRIIFYAKLRLSFGA